MRFMKLNLLTILFILFLANCASAQINLSAGLVAYWDFNGNANDNSGNNNNGTINGVTLVPGKAGIPNTAYSFDGATNYIQVPNATSLNFPTGIYSMYALVKPQGFYTGVCHGNDIIDKGDADYLVGWYTLRFSDGLYTGVNCSSPVNVNVQNFLALQNGMTTGYWYNPFIIPDTWYCVIVVSDGTSVKCYMDGVLVSTNMITGLLGSNTHDLFIGRKNSATFPYWYTGDMDEIRIYDRVLNLQEIDSLCNMHSNIVTDSIASNFQFSYPNNCDSTIVQFTDLSIGYNSTVTNWNWNFGDGNFSSSQNPTHDYLNSGSYNVTLIVTSSTGKLDTFSIPIVVVNNLPNIIATAFSVSVCNGSPTTLTASGGFTYSWTGGVTNGIPFIPLTTTTYTVTGTDANGCSNTSAVTVNVGSSLFINITPSNPILCLGDSVQLNAIGGLTYSWLPNSNINSISVSNPTVYPSSTTTYIVTGSDASGCTGTASVTIEVIEDPKISISKSGDIECNIKTIQLSANGASNYTWSPSTYLSSPNSSTTNATITQPTVFTVVASIGSCIVTDSIMVNVYENDETSFYIPNAFSPNGDGLNDCLRVMNKANFKKYYFAIYNRWGQRVFESDNTLNCWDGNFNNQLASQNTYYYYLEAETNCGKVFRKGDILLLR